MIGEPPEFPTLGPLEPDIPHVFSTSSWLSATASSSKPFSSPSASTASVDSLTAMIQCSSSLSPQVPQA
eukprot:15153321-Alexandrium_andersonii.AAC.1